jgi:hypothetical protein
MAASQYMAITFIDPRYTVSYNSSEGGTTISGAVSDSNGWAINTSGLIFTFTLNPGETAPSSSTNIIKYIIFKSGTPPSVNNIVSIDANYIYTSGLLTEGEYSLQYSAQDNPPSDIAIEAIYSTFIKVTWSQYGNSPTAYRFTLVDSTNTASFVNVYTYPDVPIGAVTLESTNGDTKIYSYILPTPPYGKYTISIGAIFGGEILSPENEATLISSGIITGASAVFSIGELLAYESEKPLAQTDNARLAPPLHVVGNKNLRTHSDLVRLNTIEMQTEAIRQHVLQEPYNNINFGSYSDYISSKVGRLQRNFAL